MTKFDPLKDQYSQAQAERAVLAFWDEHDVFHKTLASAKDRPMFVFYDGPPTANGRPGIHHVIARTIKDLICRYKAMNGFRVDRKAGWDTHGLAVEVEVEKQLQLGTKDKIVEYGIAQFNQKCRESVFKYLEDWKEITRLTGYWVDLDDAYVTLTSEYIESVWSILKNFFDRDLLYQGHRIVPFCPRCGTGLSSHEVAQGYDLVKDPSIYVKVKAADADFSYLVWTTTPWTLPSNAALCMHADATYVMIEHEAEKLVLAEALVLKVFGEEKSIVQKFKGSEFLKRRYLPLFDTFKDQSDKAFYVVNGDFVTMDDGTGIVHIAPGFGADDYEIGKQHNLPVLQAVEANGHFKEHALPYSGMFIKEADPIITKDLKKSGKLLKSEIYEHNYPFCWRCDSPLIYIARQSWYIRTTQFKEQLIRNSNAINWVPDEIRTGRMLNWLENNVDWALSRERFWGTPLPIWICDNPECAKQRAVGSIEQLRAEGHHVPADLDLHRPMIDTIKLTCDCGSTMTRVPELIDVWFDSGAMPFAQWHYPFEHKAEFESHYPADFISEAIDQTRGWFYTLLAISTMLHDKPPFKNVVVMEFILDKDGKKMSKHRGNVVDPFETITKYGADPVRWYLVSTSNPWLPTRFDEDGLADVCRKYFDTLRNTYSFFALYANIDNLVDRAHTNDATIEQFLESKSGQPERFDRWISSRYHSLIKEITASLDKYEITRPVRAIQTFVIDDLSNWYVRNNRRRFWAKGDDPSKMRAYLTLYRILEGICRATAPITPFTSEALWKELLGPSREQYGLPLSIHMTSYPSSDASQTDTALEESMELVRAVVSLGRAARSRKNLKVRQPLARLLVNLPKGATFDRLAGFEEIIQDELNIKEISSASDLNQYVSYSAKLNFKTAGPKLGNHVKAAAAFVAAMTGEQIKTFERAGSITMETDGSSVSLTFDDVEIKRNEKEGYAVESDNRVTVAIVTDLTPDLIDEGFAREMVNKIQNMRKSSGFEVTDHITVRVSCRDPLKAATARHEAFIRRETLAQKIELLDSDAVNGGAEWNINGEKAAIAVEKI